MSLTCICLPVFGGFAPVVVTWLIAVTGSKLASSLHLIATAPDRRRCPPPRAPSGALR